MTEPRYLWFAPNAGLWPSYRLEHQLANALASRGRSVTLVNCSGVFNTYCPVMAAERLQASSPSASKRAICRDCRHNVAMTREAAFYQHVDLDDFVSVDARLRADEVIASLSRENWAELVVDGFPIGRWSAYLTMLHHKLPDVTQSDSAWREYISDVRDAVLVSAVMPDLLAHADATHAIVYNPLYPTNRVFAEVSRRAGLQLVGVAAGSFIPGRYASVGIYPHIMSSQTTTDSTAIAGSISTPSTPVEIRAVGTHLRELVGGNDPWVYSSAPTRLPPAGVRAQLRVRPDSPVVIAIVSSPDETRSSMLVDAEYLRSADGGYSDVAEFISEVVAAAHRLPDVDVVFRLHPRLMPNKRESVVSPDLARITELLSDLPPNAVVNSAEDGLSLYDVMLIADAAVNQSSSAGLEFLTLGIPVVQYDPPRLGAYAREFVRLVPRSDPDALADAIADSLSEGWSLENSRRAFRWYTAVLLRSLLHLNDLSDTYRPVTEARIAHAAATDTKPEHATPLHLRLARTVLPPSWRERASRRMARAARAATIPDEGTAAAWIDEWVTRLDATAGDEPIWEPIISRRGVGDLADETQAVRDEVSHLLASLGVGDQPGIGVVAEGLRQLRREMGHAHQVGHGESPD